MTLTSGRTTVHMEAADDCALAGNGAAFHERLQTLSVPVKQM